MTRIGTGKTILVTGGAGFVGSNLIKRLVSLGHTVISLDNYFAGSKEAHVSGAEYREGHTKDIEKLISETPDVMYHLGEYARVEQSLLEPDIVHDLNIVGTHGVVEFWKKRKCKLVYAGSSTKFGDGGRAREATPYASTKAANTELIKRIGDVQNLPYTITYFYNVYGPGERAGAYGTVIEIFKRMYLSGSPIAVTAPGTQTRNFTHVDDIVDALIVVGEKGAGDEYGLGNEKRFSMLEVARMFLPASGTRQAGGNEIVMLPERSGNRMTSALDTTKIRALGWQPTRALDTYVKEFTETHARGVLREQRVLIFSTTFYPTVGPAEEALLALIRKMPDVEFDIVTTVFSKDEAHTPPPLSNAHLYRVGFGTSFDKFLLPFLGLWSAWNLHNKHRYLFAWSLMASYGAAAGMLLKRVTNLPFLVTLADQNIEDVSPFLRFMLKIILSDADQVYGMSTGQEKQAERLASGILQNSMGEGNAFANQLRYAYAEYLLHQPKKRIKKVLIFSLAYFPNDVSGAEIAIKEITDRIPSDDIEFHAVTLRYNSALPKVEQVGNVLVHRIGVTKSNVVPADPSQFPLNLNKPLFQFLAPWHALFLHRKYRYDATWALMAHSAGVPAAIFKMLHPEVKYILNLQEGDPIPYIERKMRPVWFFFTRAFTLADIVQPLSHYLADWARARGFTRPIEIIPNAVDTKYFSQEYPPKVVDEIKDRLLKKMGDVFLITTSRLVHKNAIDDVIRALVKLPPNVHFMVLGVGPEEQKLQLLAKRLKVENRVRFLGNIEYDELPKYLKACDIFIRPSRSEGFGSSFIEAMSAGLPVIATQEGGIADFLFDEKRNPDKPVTGFAVDKDSPEQIAEAVQNIMSNSEKVRAVVLTARAMVREKYDWDLIAKDMRMKVFEKIL